MAQLLMTAMGADKPGLVGELTGYLHGSGANILDSRMVNLRGQFAIILLAEAGEAEIAKLRAGLAAAGQRIGLSVTISEGDGVRPAVTGLPFKLKTYSLDQPGLMHKISAVLRGHGVNIEELSARQESAAFAGSTLFLMEMRLTVPGDMPLKKLRAALEKECEAMNCDMDLVAG